MKKLIFILILLYPAWVFAQGPAILPSDKAYDATTWNGSTLAPTQNAIRDKIETMPTSATTITDLGDATGAGTIVAGDTETLTYTTSSDGETAITIESDDNSFGGVTSLVDLKLAGDNDANGYFIRGIDDTGATPDTEFSVGPDGALAAGAITAAGTITSSGTFDATGAVAMTIGSADITGLSIITDGGTVTVPEGTITLLDTTTADSTYQLLNANLSNKAAGTDSDYARANWKTSEPTVAQGLTVIADGINWDPDSTSVDKAAAITISFNEDGATDYILDSANGLGVFSVGQAIKVAGSTESDGTYVITAVADGQLTLTATTDNLGGDEDAGDSVTLTANWPSRFQYNGSQWVKLDNIMGVKYASSIIISGITLGDTTPDAEGEVGYASNQLSIHDGTASRSLLQVASTTITKSELIPIIWAEDGTTAPAAIAQVGTTDLQARSFAEDADNDVIIYWQIPLDYSAGIKYRVYYALNANAGANETAAFALSGISVANSESLAGAMGTPVVVTDELGTDDDTSELLISDWSTAVTIDGTPAAGELAKLTFIRDTSEDDAVDHLLVAFIEIKYQAKVNASGDY